MHRAITTIRIATIILAVLCAACGTNGGDADGPVDLVGAYEGTFDGDDRGEWFITIDPDGNIEGDGISEEDGPFELEGRADRIADGEPDECTDRAISRAGHDVPLRRFDRLTGEPSLHASPAENSSGGRPPVGPAAARSPVETT